ncbi:MAG: CHASE3 domain-containing protein [Rhodopila sp.]
MSIAGTKTRIGTLLHALLAVAAIVLLPIGLWLAYDAGRSINADLTLADRAQEGQCAAGTVLSTLVDAETGQRGYLLTDNPAYLEPFNTTRGRLDADLAGLDGMLATFPEWAAPVGRIRSLAAEKLAELQRTIALHQSGQANAARDVVRGDEGRHLMVAARAETGWLEADASDRMRQALGRESNARRLVTPLGLVAGGAALLGFLAFAQRRARRASEANLAGRIHLDEALGLLPGLLRHLDGRIIAWGRGAERLYGFTAAAAVGQVSHTLLRTEFPQPRDELDAALARDGQWNGELVHRHRDGPKRIVASHWALRPAEKRGLAFVIETNNDITALRQADAAMRESEERLRTATETAGIGLVLLNREHRYRFANKAYAEILDLPSHDLAGQRLADVLPSLYDEIRQRLDRAFASERIVYELTRPAAPGRPDGRHYTVTYQLSRTVADEPVVVIVIVEITRRVLAMRALEDSQRILNRLRKNPRTIAIC